MRDWIGKQKTPNEGKLTDEFCQTFKEKYQVSLLVQRKNPKGTHPNSPYETNIALYDRQRKSTTRKKKYGNIPVANKTIPETKSWRQAACLAQGSGVPGSHLLMASLLSESWGSTGLWRWRACRKQPTWLWEWAIPDITQQSASPSVTRQVDPFMRESLRHLSVVFFPKWSHFNHSQTKPQQETSQVGIVPETGSWLRAMDEPVWAPH